MNPTPDHKPATPERPERFIAWVCADLTCPEWGAASDTPQTCICGQPSPRTVTLIAESDAQQRERERRVTDPAPAGREENP